MNRRSFLLLPLLLALTAPFGAAFTGSQSDDVAAWRARMLEIAARYAGHEWSATEKNLHHGDDPSGVRVDTPDRSFSKRGWTPGETFRGVPYAWGGFSSLEEFDRGIAAGLFAGHIPKGKRARASRRAVGVDCSGLVSRCWELPEKQSTRSIGALAYELASYDELKPGDALNRYDSHVMLFAGFVDDERTRVRVFEAVNPCVLENEHAVADLKRSGYVPLRYRPLDPRFQDDAVDVSSPTLSIAPGTEGTFEPTGERVECEAKDLSPPLADCERGQWARLARATTAEGVDAVDRDVVTIGVSRVTDDAVILHQHAAEPGARGLDRFPTVKRTRSRLDAWIPLVLTAGVPETSRSVQLVATQPGTYRVGERELPARRVEVELEIVFPGGPDGIPVWITMDAIVSDEVPVHGIVRMDAHLEILSDPDAPQIVDTRLDLLQFGAAPVAAASR